MPGASRPMSMVDPSHRERKGGDNHRAEQERHGPVPSRPGRVGQRLTITKKRSSPHQSRHVVDPFALDVPWTEDFEHISTDANRSVEGRTSLLEPLATDSVQISSVSKC